MLVTYFLVQLNNLEAFILQQKKDPKPITNNPRPQPKSKQTKPTTYFRIDWGFGTEFFLVN